MAPAEKAVLPTGIVVRELTSHAELEAAVSLQEETWGEGFRERTPASILLVAQKLGGVAAGAFSPEGLLLGFVFGMTGLRHGRIVHWSDMLAVRPEHRGRGIGQALKRYQRERCRALGIETMHWTFDPMAARNARLNLNRLGARVDEFVVDMYGSNTGSPLHSLGTDRFVVSWPIRDEPVPLPDDAECLRDVVVVAGPPEGMRGALPEVDRVAVRVPLDLSEMAGKQPARARHWHASVRRAFERYLRNGWEVSAFVTTRDVATYVLSRGPDGGSQAPSTPSSDGREEPSR